MAGSTNLVQWNNGAINQETDSQYAVDSLRTGGAPTGGVLPSPTFNKLAYQLSTFVAAFGEMLANKNFSTSDADINVLSAVLANIITSADIPTPLVVVPFSPTPTLAAANVGGFYMSLTGNSAIQAITGLTTGQLVAMYYLQDSIGGRVVTFPAAMFSAITPDPTPNSLSVQLFRFDGIGGGFLRPAGPLVSNNGLFSIGTGNFTGGLEAGGAVIAPNATITTLLTAGNLDVSGTSALASLVTSGNANLATLFVPGNANLGALQVAGGAPNGQVLTGNGTTYVPLPLPTKTVTRNDVTGSRSFGSTFTNTSGGLMLVEGYGNTAGGSVASVACFINGDQGFSDTDGGTAVGGACGFSFSVPPGQTYEVQINTMTDGGHGVTTLGKWIETIVSL